MNPRSSTSFDNNSDSSQEATENALLAKISRIITSSPDIDEVYEKFAETLKTYIDFDRIVIGTVDLERWTTTVSYVVGTKVAIRPIGYEMPLGGTNVEAVVRDRSGIILQPSSIEEAASEYPGLAQLYETGLRSFLSVPLIAKDEVIGVLLLRSCKPHLYTKQDLELAERVGKQIAGAIVNAQLKATVDRDAKERAAIAEIGRVIGSTPNISDVYEQFVEQVRQLIPFDRLAVSLKEADQDEMAVIHVSGNVVTGRGVGIAYPLKGTLSEAVVRSRSGIIFQYENEDDVPQDLPGLLPGFSAGLKAALGVPLIADDSVIGVLQFRSTNPNAYDDDDVRLAQAVANQIAGAIVNARLNESLEREAHEQEVLANIGRIITSSSDIDEIYERFAKEVHKLIPFDNIAIGIVDLARGIGIPTYRIGVDWPGSHTGEVFSLAGTSLEEVVKTRRGLLIRGSDIEEIKGRFPGLSPAIEAGIKSFITVPLISTNEVIGALALRSARWDAYSEQDLAFAEQVANQIAGAMANSQLNQALEREAHEQEVLANVGRIITSSSDIDEVYERFAEEVQKLVPFDRLAIGIVDLERGIGIGTYRVGLDVSGRRRGDVYSLSGTTLEAAINSRSAILVQGPDVEAIKSQYPGFSPPIETGVKSSISVAFFSNSECIGGLGFSSTCPEAYTERHRQLAEQVANQIAGAVANAHLHAEAQQEAIVKQVLAEIGRIISSSTSIGEVFERFSEQVKKLVPFDRIVLEAIEGDGDEYHTRHVLGVNIEEWTSANINSNSGPIMQIIARTRKGMFVNASSEDDLLSKYSGQEAAAAVGLISLLSAPLISNNEVIGVLNFRSKQPNAYSDRELQLAERIASQVVGAVANAWNYEERGRAEQTLRASEAKFRGLLESAPDAIIIIDSNGAIQFVNTQTEETFGYTRGELLGQPLSVFLPVELREEHERHQAEYIRDPHTRPMGAHFNITGRRKDGSTFPADVELSPMQSDEGLLIISTVRDITERHLLEDQLRHSQKMDAVGQLAGGVAHDFNNLLSVVTSYSELLMGKLQGEEKLLIYLQEIRKAADRATNLTRQLLTFSHRQVNQQKIVDLNSLMVDLTNMLRRLIGEDIELVILPSQSLGMIKADPSQIEQVLINLVVNSRDAMPLGGKLIISTEDVVLDEVYARSHPDVPTGTYVMVKVQDDGEGIPADVLPHIFEPFYTTKDQGKGTGLGLSTCYGIIAQSGGHIAVDSTLEEGTTFRVYLPLVAESVSLEKFDDATQSLPTGGETILLVEDEPLVMSVASEVLTDHGYTVIQAENGAVALHFVEENPDQTIDLILTDLVMPFIGGKELVERIKTLLPDVSVMYTSGYTSDDRFQAMLRESDVEFLPKPFSLTTLTRKVRENLDRGSTSSK